MNFPLYIPHRNSQTYIIHAGNKSCIFFLELLSHISICRPHLYKSFLLFSVLLYHERISPRMGLGFLLIFASILLSETWPALCRRFGPAWPVPAVESAQPAGGIVSAADGNTAGAKK